MATLGLGMSRQLATARYWLSVSHRPYRVGVAIVAVLFLSSSAPTPIYIVYQRRWGFSAGALTAVFGIYSLTVIIALFTLGPVSDHIGRRTGISIGLGLMTLGLVSFAIARNLAWLFAARSLQGLGVGTTSAALSAQVVEMGSDWPLDRAASHTSMASSFGMASGSLVAGVSVSYLPGAPVSFFTILSVVMIGALVLGRFIPETVGREIVLSGRESFVPGTGGTGNEFVLLLCGTVATWAIGGLYLSLGPSIVAQILHLQSHLLGGVVVFELGLVGGLTASAARLGARQTEIACGAGSLLVGLVIVMYSVHTATVSLFYGGSVVLAAGWGLMNASLYRSLISLAPPRRRAKILSKIYIWSYVAFSVPSILVGMSSDHFGLRVVTLTFGACAGTLVLVAAIGVLLVQRPTKREPGPLCRC